MSSETFGWSWRSRGGRRTWVRSAGRTAWLHFPDFMRCMNGCLDFHIYSNPPLPYFLWCLFECTQVSTQNSPCVGKYHSLSSQWPQIRFFLQYPPNTCSNLESGLVCWAMCLVPVLSFFIYMSPGILLSVCKPQYVSVIKIFQRTRILFSLF